MQSCYPITAPVRTAATEPTLLQEPISVEDARHQCGLARDNTYHDTELQSKITAARRQVEKDAQVVCYTGTFTYALTEFPWGDYFELPDKRPITAISSITYVDGSGTTQTLSASVYSLDTNGKVPIVKLAYGQVWPAVRGDINGIIVTFVAGYSTVLAIPVEIKKTVKLALRIDWLYEMGDAAEAQRQQVGYDRQIELIRLETYG